MAYRHTQIGTVTIVSLGLATVVTAAALHGAAGPLAGLAGGGVCALLLVAFGSLTVSVDPDSVRLRFGPGPIARTIPLRRIAAARVVRNSWLAGWGIRLTPRGWLWNVSGLDAVEIDFADGGHFRIGTDEPEALARAIRGKIGG